MTEQPWVGLVGHRPTHCGARLSQSDWGFSPQKGFITDRNAPQFHQLSGWLVSDDPAVEETWMWRSWAGVDTRGL
jgi:hypothetical protein